MMLVVVVMVVMVVMVSSLKTLYSSIASFSLPLPSRRFRSRLRVLWRRQMLATLFLAIILNSLRFLQFEEKKEEN